MSTKSITFWVKLLLIILSAVQELLDDDAEDTATNPTPAVQPKK